MSSVYSTVGFGSPDADATNKVVPRFSIVMASALDEETCRRINLGYMDYCIFNVDDFSNEDTLIVERASRDLYLGRSRLNYVALRPSERGKAAI